DLLELDALALEEPVEVRELREHADRADDRERRGDDLVGDASHQVSAARRDLVDGDVERNALLPDPHQLRRGEAVVVHGAARILEADEDEVALRRDREHGRHLVPQGLGRARAEVTLEIDHEDAAPPVAVSAGLLLLLVLLALLGAALQQLLEVILAVHGAPQHVRLLLELPVQVLDLETVRMHAATADADEQRGGEKQNAEHRDQLRDEQRVFGGEIGHYSPTLLCSNTRSAR